MCGFQPLPLQVTKQVTIEDNSVVDVAVVVKVEVVFQDLPHFDFIDAKRQIKQNANELGARYDVKLIFVILNQDLSEVKVELGSLPEDVC